MWDGPATIQAIALDEAGTVLRKSAVIPFTVANGNATIALYEISSTSSRGSIKPNIAQEVLSGLKAVDGMTYWYLRQQRIMSIQEVAFRLKVYPSPCIQARDRVDVFLDGKLIPPGESNFLIYLEKGFGTYDGTLPIDPSKRPSPKGEGFEDRLKSTEGRADHAESTPQS